MIYEIAKADKNAATWKMRAARAAIAAGLALIFAGVTFAGQAGIGLASRLADHQHTGAGDGAVLQGLAPVGNFIISGNNAGNIGISSSITGSNFIWKPASTTFIAGQATDDSFYVTNIGGYSWIGGKNTMSRGDYSLAFGTNVKNYRTASIALGYYLQNNAGNSVMIGSGPGFGSPAYAINNDTGSIKFFPFTVTAETRPMLNMKADNTAEVVGVWNFTSTPTINGVEISTYGMTIDNSKVLKAGDTMTGPLTLAGSTLTVTGNAFSVGGSTLVVSGGVTTIDSVLAGVSPLVVKGANTGNQFPLTLVTKNGSEDGSGGAGMYFTGVNTLYSKGGILYNITSGYRRGDLHFLNDSAADGGSATMTDSVMVLKSGGNVGIGTAAPQTKLHVSSGIIRADGTGGGFAGNGSSITAVTTFVSSSGVTGFSIASITDVGIATATITNRGGRVQLCRAHFTINNAAGAARDYTYALLKNGTRGDDYVQTVSGTSTEYVAIDVHETSSTAGAVTWGLVVRSSSASGAQTINHPHVDCFEY